MNGLMEQPRYEGNRSVQDFERVENGVDIFRAKAGGRHGCPRREAAGCGEIGCEGGAVPAARDGLEAGAVIGAGKRGDVPLPDGPESGYVAIRAVGPERVALSAGGEFTGQLVLGSTARERTQNQDNGLLIRQDGDFAAGELGEGTDADADLHRLGDDHARALANAEPDQLPPSERADDQIPAPFRKGAAPDLDEAGDCDRRNPGIDRFAETGMAALRAAERPAMGAVMHAIGDPDGQP